MNYPDEIVAVAQALVRQGYSLRRTESELPLPQRTYPGSQH